MMNADKIKTKYNRAARLYDFFEKPMEAMLLKSQRINLMGKLNGKVLEVGVGTGKNIEYYPDNLDITAIDFSDKMLEKAEIKAKKYNKNVKLKLMDVEQMEFEDDSFDTVFTTCVFCSVPDPIKGLKEIGRVCRKNGKIILIEHVKSEKKVIGLLMDIFNPVVVNLYGANINRDTVRNVKKAGFSNIKVTNLWKDIVKEIMIYNEK